MPTTMCSRAGAAALGVAVAFMSAAASYAAAAPGVTVRVSVASDGSGSEYEDARQPAISADGRYVAFSTVAPMAENDTGYGRDVYLHDTATRVTELVSVGRDGRSPMGGMLPAVSADGRYLVFVSDADIAPGTGSYGGTYLRDRSTGTTIRVGPKASLTSWRPDISADGRFVVFVTSDGAVPGDTNRDDDVYLWDRTTGALTVVSAGANGRTAPGGSSEPTVSDDGRFVAYDTSAEALNGGVEEGRIVVTDRTTRRTTVVSAASGNTPAISGDGRWVTYLQFGVSDQGDVLLWQRTTGTTTTVSVDIAGRPAEGMSMRPRINADGRYVAYWSTAKSLVSDTLTAPLSLFRWDRTSGRNTVAMTPQDNAFHVLEEVDISADGRFVAYDTQSGALTEGDTNRRFDVFRTELGTTPAALAMTRAPVVVGSVKVGATVRVVPGDWTFIPTSYTYQWAVGGAAVAGATGASHRVTANDLGKRLSVTVTARREGYLPGTAGPTASAVVARGDAPRRVAGPRITGTPTVGATVWAEAGRWWPAARSYRYEWRLDNAVIRGAGGPSLKLTAAMRGRLVTLTVIAQRAAHRDGRATGPAVMVRG